MGWAMDFFDMGKRVWAEVLTLKGPLAWFSGFPQL